MLIDILSFAGDENLLGDEFRSPTWRPRKTFLRALYALPPSPKDRKLYSECTGRTDWPRQPYREAALIVGRRGGKSRVLALIASYLAVCGSWQPYLSAGETAVIAVIAADRNQARVILSYCKGLLRQSDLIAELIEDELTETIRLSNRVNIEIHSGRISSPRGRTYAGVLADEIAFWRSDESANPDKEILTAVRPGLASLAKSGSLLLMASSPYARKGELWRAYREHYAKEGGDRMLVWKAPTRTMNPALDKNIIDEAFADDPIAASAEYGAEFRSDVASYISREVIEACTAWDVNERIRQPATTYQAFTDPSGGSADSFTLAIAHREGDVGVLDVIRETQPPFSPESVVEEYARLLLSYGIRSVTGDRYGAEWVAEQFRKHYISYEPSDRAKSDLYRELFPLLNSRKADLLDNLRLITQLAGLERRTARGGKDSIDHAPGGHDDMANAAAGALVLVAGKPDAMEIWRKLAGGGGGCPEVANIPAWARQTGIPLTWGEHTHETFLA